VQKLGQQDNPKPSKSNMHQFAGTHLGNRFEFWHAGWYLRCNHPCQILSPSVHGFQSSNTLEVAILHELSLSPLQQCNQYCAALWYITA